MEPNHELAARAPSTPRPHLELVQKRKLERVYVIRCPSCDGLRGVQERHVTRSEKMCQDCRRGKVIRREDFYGFWLEQFSDDEIKEMADAIDALLGLRIR